ncbi:hypothetical protein HRI_004582500 [Hibiscus trionum]|uniref:BHLH domain-containing protein n=1 Tax=Hibiscus trionum TaxID=183268 RepID=A0A9W7JA65_HIBTR|nr:hypothetical protein HRI_004582500 [Hibiscus trionum]
MDGQPGHENPHMSLNSGRIRNVNDFSYDYMDHTNSALLAATGRNKNRPSLQSLSQWIDCPKMPHSYVEFLTENLENVPTADVLESIGSPVGGIHAVDGISEIRRKAFSSGPNAFSLELEHGNLNLPAYSTEINNHEASASGRVLRQQPRLSVNKFLSSEYEFHAQQNHAFWMQEPKEDHNVYQFQSKGTVGAPSFWSKPRYCVPKPRAPANDRQRRIRIAEGIKALQELLPNSSERGRANALDDVIDYVKFLQLQIKELSLSRLGGEPSSNPLGFFELLESRGLHMMPRELVEGLDRAS